MSLGHCPYAQAQFSYPAPIDAWLERSIDVVVGTDCGACNDTMNLQQELRLIAGGPGVGVGWSPALDNYLARWDRRRTSTQRGARGGL